MQGSGHRFVLKIFSRAKEFWKTIQYFILLQIFFASMMLSFNFFGPFAFGVILAIPPLIGFFMGRRQGLLLIFYFMVVTFTVGQRTLFVGEYFRIVPTGILLWILAILCILIKPRIPVKPQFPLAIITLFLFTLFACWYRERWVDLNLSLFYAHMMWLAIPAFYVTERLIQRFEQMHTVVIIIAFGCLFLSFLALSEYFKLSYIHYFGGFLSDFSKAGIDKFRRLGASFWGGPMLAGYLTLSFPLVCSQFMVSKTLIQKMILGISMTLMVLVIYFAGHRGVWVAFLIGMGCFFYLRGVKGVLILVLLAILGFQFIPQQAKARMHGLSGEKRDSSTSKREDRAIFAWQLIEKKPIQGHGWGKSGLVHSDLLQLWADSGLGAFVSFFALYAIVLIRLLRQLKRVRHKIFREYFYGFFASLAGIFIILCTEAWFNLAEQYTPFWVVMALAYRYPTIVKIENQILMQQMESQSPRVNAATI